MFIASLVAAALALGGVTTSSIPDHPTTLIVGDSISHNNTKENPAWWTYLDIDPILSAQPGSGYLSKGRRCEGTRFRGRLDRVADEMPDLIIVAGGRNDFRRCHGTKYSSASRHAMRTAIRTYLQALAEEVDRIGLGRKKVIVIVPWGASKKEDKVYIRTKVKQYAKHRGFRYRYVPPGTRETTLDDVHPTRRGNRELGLYVADHSPLERKPEYR